MSIIYGKADSEKNLLNKYPKQVKKIDDIPIIHQEIKDKIVQKDTGLFAIFRKWNKKRQLRKFENNLHHPLHKGARGENKVIDELSKLGDDFYILCGLKIRLRHLVTYNQQKNLRSAQMDFVVVSRKGVFVIEVKNWSDDFVKTYSGFSPHEQTDRAGMVLWITLDNFFIKTRVTNVLLSITGNIHYDSKYKTVYVSSLDRINDFLINRPEILSENDVKKIVYILRNYVTK